MTRTNQQSDFEPLAGITFPRWSSMRIPAGGLQIRLTADGAVTSSVVVETHIAMWIHWLDICCQHVKTAHAARQESLESRRAGGTRAPHASMHVEFQSSVQAISAAAFALEAFSNALEDFDVVDAETKARWQKQKPRAADKVVETALAASSVSAEDLDRDAIVTIFQARNAVVHPKVEFREPVMHPALKLGVDQALITYGLEHAAAALSQAATLIARTLLDALPVSDEMEQWLESTTNVFAQFARAQGIGVSDGDARLQTLLDRGPAQGNADP